AAYTVQIGDGDTLAPPALVGAALKTPRTEHTATRLSDETGADVLIIGGKDAAGLPVGTVEVFRPLSDEFEEVIGATMLVPRWGHIAVRLPGGFVLVLGGWQPDGLGGQMPVADMELYDPVLGRFTSAGRLASTAGVNDLTATPLPDGRVLLAGGRNEAGTPVSTTLIAQLDPANGRVNIIATNSLAAARAGQAAIALCDGTVLLVGGADGAPAERYNPPAAGRR
ncbi:MAG TPA: hypothetical protein VL172_11805, partial [Kofleriaceae bacterium]|nr:hypothetical protein [Kofleriaceae bacterium]